MPRLLISIRKMKLFLKGPSLVGRIPESEKVMASNTF